MHLVLGESKGNATVASRLSDKRILAAEFQVYVLSFMVSTDRERQEEFAESDDVGRPRSVRCVRTEEQKIKVIGRQPIISTTGLEDIDFVSHASANGPFQDQ
jgi:hypothetical protein